MNVQAIGSEISAELARKFTCDICGEQIESPDQALLEFEYETPTSTRYKTFRIVHELNVSCRDSGWPSAPLSTYMGLDGMAKMLGMLVPPNSLVSDITEWVGAFYRIHVPQYEEARHLLDETWEYRQEEMADALATQADEEQSEPVEQDFNREEIFVNTQITESEFYDSVSDEQELFVCTIPVDGEGVEVADALVDVTVGVFLKLREEGFQRPFTVFIGGTTGNELFIGLQRPDFRHVYKCFDRFIGARFPFSPPVWRKHQSPQDGLAAPRFRFTTSRFKDYRPDGAEQVGNQHNRHGVEMTFFEVLPCFEGESDSYND